jgi:predicted lipoprotein with Yx(FWY)xxD motif
VPLTRTKRPSPLYVALDPPEGGLRDRSYAMPEMVRVWTVRVIALLVGLSALLVLSQDATAANRGTVTVRSSRYGAALFDGRGFVLYAFTKDARGKSTCSGACAAAWPPYVVKQQARAGAGVTASLLGTARRADGSLQVSYAGRPLYYYVGDRSPGQILCQNVREYAGLWLLVRANGRLVR